MGKSVHHAFGGLLAAMLACSTAGASTETGTGTVQDLASLQQQPAVRRAWAADEMLLAATRAGQRLVAVGDHGVVLLSDDGGRSFRQAQAVPTRATLTSVSFADDRNGWAVGHWGVILHSADGGETWTLQHSAPRADRPLFSVYFADAEHGLAVGLWSLVLATADGGKTWKEVELPVPPQGSRADRNLFAIFADSGGAVYVAAERGTVLRAKYLGGPWDYLSTGYTGSFWAGCALKDGTLLVGGLRGTIYRSADGGRSWSAISSGTKSSITSFVKDGDKVLAVGLDGIQLQSSDGGLSFDATQLANRLPLTSVTVSATGAPLVLSTKGIVRP